MLGRAVRTEIEADAPRAGAVRPFDRFDPPATLTPLVHASPHSGRLYPEALLQASVLDASAIRRSEDARVDELLAGAPASGGPLLTAATPAPMST
jgi:N-formylglutamate deformylase